MEKILRIFKLLLCFIIVIAGFIYADSYSSQHSVGATGKTLLLTIGALPGILAYCILNGNFRKQYASLLRPVPFSVWVWRFVGFAISSFGFFLFIGNRSGQFLSFPFAGTLVCVIGLVILAAKAKG
ncbi:MAG: hypothetical protein V4447_03040 [Pseudomonadota bacterium]